MVVQVYIRTNRIQEFPFFHIHISICALIILIIVILTGVMWLLFMVLGCITMMISDAEHFHGLVGYLYVFFEKCLFECSAYFLIWFFFFLLSNFVISSYVLHFNSLSNIIGKYFLSVHSSPFHFVNGFLCCAEASKFNGITVAYFWYTIFVFNVKTSLPRLMSRSFSSKCSSSILTVSDLIHDTIIFFWHVYFIQFKMKIYYWDLEII